MSYPMHHTHRPSDIRADEDPGCAGPIMGLLLAGLLMACLVVVTAYFSHRITRLENQVDYLCQQQPETDLCRSISWNRKLNEDKGLDLENHQ